MLLALLLVRIGYAQQAQIDSLTAALQTADESKQSELRYRLSLLYANTNFPKSVEFANQALASPHKPADEINIRQHLGSLYHRTGDMNRAIDNYKQALLLSNEAGNERQRAQANMALGGAYFIIGNLGESLDNYLQALRFYEQQRDQNRMVSVFNGLANIYTKQNNFSKALEYNLKAAQIYEASSDRFRTLLSYDQVGNMYFRQKNYRKANEYFLRSLNLYRELNNRAGEASTLIQLGNISYESGQFDAAAAQYKKSLVLSKQLNMVPLQVTGYNAMALTYEKQKLFDKAIIAAKNAEQLARSSNLKIELELSYETLSRLYKQVEAHDKATTFETLSKEIKDSLYNDSTLKQLADLQLRYEGEKNQRQIQLQQKEQQVLASELLRERQLRNAIIAMLAIVMLGMAVFFYLFTQNKRIAQNLSRQKKELEQTTHEILRQKEELGQLNTVKDRFFSIISHDLRNNLTTMKLYFDLMSNPDYTPDEDSGELSRQISSSVENTIDLLENLLVWAQAQIKGIEANPVILDVHHLAEDNISLMGGNAHQKGIRLINKVEADITAFADEDMLNLVLRNLISNAIKFTPQHGSITISANSADTYTHIHVADTGVGISPQSIEKLFVKNINPTTLGTANEKGTGLGLILCKEFIEKNNGRITVTSTPGKGSTFTVVIPQSQA